MSALPREQICPICIGYTAKPYQPCETCANKKAGKSTWAAVTDDWQALSGKVPPGPIALTPFTRREYFGTPGAIAEELFNTIEKDGVDTKTVKGKAAEHMYVEVRYYSQKANEISVTRYSNDPKDKTATKLTEYKFRNSVQYRGCFEGQVMPPDKNLQVESLCIVVLQSIAPCDPCKKAFMTWAQKSNTTILVKYASAGGNKGVEGAWLIFPSSGDKAYSVP